MAVEISKQFSELLKQEDTVKVLVTVTGQGQVHAVVKNSLQVYEANKLCYLELLESAQSNKNMVRSLWFNQDVTIAIAGAGGESYQVKARPVKSVVSGHLFREFYSRIRAELGDVDLAAIWILEPQEIVEQTFSVRRQQEEANRPYFKHLDRLIK